MHWVIILTISIVGGPSEEYQFPVTAGNYEACDGMLSGKTDIARRWFVQKYKPTPGVLIVGRGACWTPAEAASFAKKRPGQSI